MTMMASTVALRHGLIRVVASRRVPLALTTLPERRWFSRKGARMGHHLETLEELAHRESHEQAKERRRAKKLEKHKTLASSLEDDILEEVQFDEGDDHFDHGDNNDDEQAPILPDPAEVKERMLKVVNRLVESFKAIRGSEPTPDIFDSIMVDAYGERTLLSAVAQVVITSPTMATITCFDPSVAPEVRKAIQIAMEELNPQMDEDGVLKVQMPRPTAETRQKTVKHLGKQAESGRQRIRGIRRAALELVKKGEKGKLEGISKDDAFRVQKEIDAVADECVELLNQAVHQKQESVMAV
jgi:ribosome recycling factor